MEERSISNCNEHTKMIQDDTEVTSFRFFVLSQVLWKTAEYYSPFVSLIA